MKRYLEIVLILATILFMFTGCSFENFFDVRSAMSPPALSVEQTNIEASIKDYLGDFKFSCPMIQNKYSTVLKCNVGGAEYMVVFCETEDGFMKSHCIFFENKSGKWEIKDDIVEGNFKVQSADVLDTNNDGFDEIVIKGTDMNNLNSKIYTYQIQKNGIISVQ